MTQRLRRLPGHETCLEVEKFYSANSCERLHKKTAPVCLMKLQLVVFFLNMQENNKQPCEQSHSCCPGAWYPASCYGNKDDLIQKHEDHVGPHLWQTAVAFPSSHSGFPEPEFPSLICCNAHGLFASKVSLMYVPKRH